jgi:hypothetical protein
MGKAFPYPVIRVWCFALVTAVGRRSVDQGPRDRLEALGYGVQGSWHPPTLVTAFRVLSTGFRRFSL